MKTLETKENTSLVLNGTIYFVYYNSEFGTMKRFFFMYDTAKAFYDSCVN